MQAQLITPNDVAALAAMLTPDQLRELYDFAAFLRIRTRLPSLETTLAYNTNSLSDDDLANLADDVFMSLDKSEQVSA